VRPTTALGAIAVIGVITMPSLAAVAVDAGGPDLDTSKTRYQTGQTVVIRVSNESEEWLRFKDAWRIRRARSGDVVARRRWRGDSAIVRPGGRRTWRWDQRVTGCGKTGAACPRVDPGRFEVVVKTGTETLTTSFQIGRYFTLGFDGSNATFVVYVRERKPMRRMSNQAEKKDKTLIVSGIVRGDAGYNPDWSYTMGPGSIVLGEVFIETCDASPQYVEDNRKQWMGQRWCPWSSYVEKKGKP
jgi:hypothetical protein